MEFSAPITNDSVLTILHFRAALGNDTNTNLVAESIQTESGSAIISTVSGVFTLQGVCREGATARLYRSATAASVQITPNPIEQSGEIIIVTGEKGRVKVSLCSVMGTEVAVLADGEFSDDTYSIPFQGDGLSAGVYFLMVELPTHTFSRRVIIR